MVELAVYNLLAADATLRALLGGSAGVDSKIYPIRAPQSKAYPFITYAVSAYGDTNEYVHTDRLTLKIVEPDYNNQRAIRDRLIVLLDYDKNQGKITFTSANYRIEYSRLVGGQDMEDTIKDQDTEETIINLIQIYEFTWLYR
ncbi:unnamed protein product [marine sediment metagenome]|uniref:DUF3168 domain-containing protein n=1 Tax=marine sediment metagenome TaxID=412755 RepID=X0Z3G7_9ZZZZ